MIVFFKSKYKTYILLLIKLKEMSSLNKIQITI